jgi:nucleoid DNA-binding protein
MSFDPSADIFRKPFVELVKVLRHHEPVVLDVSSVHNGEWIGLTVFHRQNGEIYILIFDCGGIALHGNTSFREEMNCMQASLRGREALAARVQQALSLPTKKQAEMIADTVIAALEATLLNNLGTDGFTLKLGSFGKFSVRHKPGILRKIPFTGETILTKGRRKVRFITLGRLRQQERVD